MNDRLGAFVDIFESPLRGRQEGPLAGMRFAVKDLFDIRGMVTGAGNPDWIKDRQKAAGTASSIQRLLDAGAALVGKTHTDELAFSLNGENAHFGTPVNPAAPNRVPGGSSSGSVSAVAGGVVDFAVGTDTGGSVRLPASYCGVWGVRSSHGRVPVDGLVPLAASFDTVGWFARDADVLAAVGEVLLPPDEGDPPPMLPDFRILWPRDAFDLIDDAVRDALRAQLERLLPPEAGLIEGAIADVPGGLRDWLKTFQTIQWYEAWSAHGEWIESRRPAFGPGIAERFAGAAKISSDAYTAAIHHRREIAGRLDMLFAAHSPVFIAMPIAGGPAPLKNLPQEAMNVFRTTALTMLCPAGLGGLPQISIPGATMEGAPVGLGLIGPRGADRNLLAYAAACAAREAMA